MNWLDPEQVRAWLSKLGKYEHVRWTEYVDGNIVVHDKMRVAAVKFVKAYAAWLKPNPGCDCDTCKVARAARLIARRLESNDGG